MQGLTEHKAKSILDDFSKEVFLEIIRLRSIQDSQKSDFKNDPVLALSSSLTEVVSVGYQLRRLDLLFEILSDKSDNVITRLSDGISTIEGMIRDFTEELLKGSSVIPSSNHYSSNVVIQLQIPAKSQLLEWCQALIKRLKLKRYTKAVVCTACGGPCQLVRPGKYQCPECE